MLYVIDADINMIIFLRGDNLRFLKSKKLITGILISTMTLTSGLMVFADTDSEFVDNIKGATLVRRGEAPIPSAACKKHGSLKAVIEKLVEEGKLSREKAEAIEKFMEKKREENKKLSDDNKKEFKRNKSFGLLTDLVEAKLITNEEAGIIRGKLIELKELALDEKLNKLIQQGTITKPQAEKIMLYFKNACQERAAQHEKLKNMTEEQRKEFFANNKKGSIMNKLIEDGVINQQQAEELKKAFGEGPKE